jgi:hypothetical protein
MDYLGKDFPHQQNNSEAFTGTFFSPICFYNLKLHIMAREQTSRSGSKSSSETQKTGSQNNKESYQKGATNKTNRHTGGSKRHERDDSNRGADHNTTKKGSNSI